MRRKQKTKKVLVVRTDGGVTIDSANQERNFRIDLIRSLTEDGTPIVMSGMKRELSLSLYEAPTLTKRQAARLIKKVKKFHKELESDMLLNYATTTRPERDDSGQSSSPSTAPYAGLAVESISGRLISSERLPHMRVMRQ